MGRAALSARAVPVRVHHEDTILAFGIDNLFNEYYVKYLDLRTQGSNNLVPSPSPGITFKGSLKVRFGDTFFRNG